eukprot:SAG31_NODE_3278_length_4472_cov_1.683512_3_plen_72_part_00
MSSPKVDIEDSRLLPQLQVVNLIIMKRHCLKVRSTCIPTKFRYIGTKFSILNVATFTGTLVDSDEPFARGC